MARNLKTKTLLMVFSIALFFFCITTGHARQARPYQIRTPHYILKTNVSENFARLLARHMEAIYEEYEAHFKDFRLEPTSRAVIKVFRERARYDAVAPEPLRGTAGGFIADSNIIMTFLGDRSREDVLRTLYHEGFHQFAHDRLGRDVPMWLNEGMAEYFAEATWSGESFITGQKPLKRIENLQEAIQSRNFIPLSRLFPIENRQWMANVHKNDTLARLQYDQAWSVIHFLLHANNGQYSYRLSGYLESHIAGKGPVRAFTVNFGRNIRSMQDAWKKYVMELEPDPLSVCRHKMKTLMTLANMLHSRPQDFRDLDNFTRMLLEGERRNWRYEDPFGNVLTPGNTNKLRQILKCRQGEHGGLTGYILLNNDRTGMPELYCTYHPGIVIKAHLTRHRGRWHAVTEVITRKILSDSILERLEQKKDSN